MGLHIQGYGERGKRESERGFFFFNYDYKNTLDFSIMSLSFTYFVFCAKCVDGCVLFHL